MKPSGLRILLLLLTSWAGMAQGAVDSYRFMHVTIETPWYIFLFLLIGIFAPFILMAVLAWVSAARKAEPGKEEHKSSPEE